MWRALRVDLVAGGDDRLPKRDRGFASILEIVCGVSCLAGDAHMQFSAYEPAVRVPKNTPVARAFIRSIRQHGGNPRFVVKTGTSDLNVVSEKWDCPMLAYGPGDSLLDHTPHEHINIHEYQSAIEVLTTVLDELSGALDTSHRGHATRVS